MRLTVVGGFGLGVSFFVARAPEAGETVSGATLLQTPGGKGSNQAVGAARLGASVAFLSAIADDDAGRLGRQLWAAEGVDADGVAVLDGTTMVGAIITDAAGENRIVIADGVLGTFGPAQVDAARASFEGASVVLVSTEIATSAAARALRLGRDAGARTILNPAPAPDPAAIDWTCVDVITPNESEAAQLLGRAPDDRTLTPGETARELRARFDVDVVMTMGGDGALVAERENGLEAIASHAPDRIVDTTGAGDSFNAGLAVGLLRGLDLASAARIGTVCGSLTVETAGVIPALPTRDRVVAQLRSRSEDAVAAALDS